MRRLIVPVVVLAAVAVALVATSVAGAGSPPTLVGVVGKNDAYKLTLTQNGKLVKTLKAGTYKFVIHDYSSLHSFSMDGPNGKSWDFTTVPQKTTKTQTIKLTAGKYKAYCHAHESTMFQHFTVK